MYYNDEEFIECHSKVNTDESLPQRDFIAAMTARLYNSNCPLVPGAKFSTTYDDPKEFDETQNPLYIILKESTDCHGEILYTFQVLRELR